MRREIIVLSLLTILVFSNITAIANAETQKAIPVKAWAVSGTHAYSIDSKHILIGQSSRAKYRCEVSYNPYTGYIVYQQPIKIYDVKGNLIASDSPPSGYVRVSKFVSGSIQKVVDIPLPSGGDALSVWAIPQGVLIARADAEIYLYDYDGSLIKKVNATEVYGGLSYSVDFDMVVSTVDGKLIISQSARAGNIVLLDYYLNPILRINGTEVGLEDPEVVVVTSDYVASFDNVNTNKLIIIDRNTKDYRVYSGNPSAGDKYYAVTTTYDGRYIFAVKTTGYIEVWKWNGGTNLELVETIEAPASFGVTDTNDIGQPNSPVDYYTYGYSNFIALPNAIIFYDPDRDYYEVTPISDISGRMATIDRQGNYLVAGNTVFILLKQDIQSGEPRIRFEGDLVYNPTQSYPWELSTSFVLEAPENKPYHIYFESGQIKITYVSAEERPVELITDDDIVNGRLGKMRDRGLVRYDVIYAEGASIENARIDRYPNDKDPNGERTVIFERTHVLHELAYGAPFGGGSTADSGVIIEVPLNTKLSPYSNLTLEPKFAIATVAPHFNITEELLGVGGQIIGSGASLYTAKSLGKGWLRNYLTKKGFDELAIRNAVSKWAKVGTKWGSRFLFVVGTALAVDTGVELYAHYETLENIRTTIYTIPIIVDTETGKKYAVVKYYLPQEAMNYKDDFEEHVLSYLERVGIDRSNVGVTFTAPAGVQTWRDYNNMLRNGSLPKPNLLELVKNNIVGVPAERLRIEKIIIVVDTITTGYASLFDVFTGGYKIPIATIVYGYSIQVSGKVPKFETGDPSEIALLIPKIEINGQEYDVSPSTDGAIAQFALPIGTDKFVLRFPNAEHMRAWFQLKATTLVKAPMVDKGGYYEADFHYDWKYGEDNLVIVTKRMEFVDMPYPMEYAEREIKLLYGRVEPLEITNYFELSQVIDDANSPSGKRYYYVTQDPKFLDPSNGARMQTCKTYIFRYWYVTPPQPYEPKPNETIPKNETEPLPPNATSPLGNAWIKLYLNGTTNASSIPRMLVVWVGSTGTEDNTVSVEIMMRAGYLDSEDKPVYTINETRTFTVTIPPNSTYVQFYDIQKFIAEAIKYAPRGFFEAVGVITQATYNKVISDDADRVTYFPPSTIPPSGSVVALNVKVVDAVNLAAVQGADVYVDDSLFGTTDANGWANGTVVTGLHRIKVTKDGYQTYEGTINVFDNMSVTIELEPLELPTTYHELEVLVQYQDGAPYEGANVTVKDNSTGTALFAQKTDDLGLAEFMIEHGKVVDVFITAGNHTFNFTGINMVKDYRIVATVPETSPYFEPEVAISNVTFKIHWGMGWFYGKTPHLVETWVFSNVPQTITLHYRAFDVETNETLNETDLTVYVHKGTNYVMNWVYLAVRNETRKVATYVEITSYEQDTNLENNRMRSNIVVIKPFIDLSVTVLWKPVKQKTPLAILPGDLIEVDIGFMIPCKLSGIEIRADINSHNLYTNKLSPLERHHDVVASSKPNTTIWYNTTVTIPFTDKIVVNASIYHPWEYMGWNNYINTTIKIFPDTEVSHVSIGALLVQSGQDVDITVKLRSNAIGRGVGVSVFDEDVGDLIGTTHVEISEPEMDVKFTLTAPTISGFYETHTWNVSSATVDYWSENDYKTLSVTIWNIPWWAWLLIFLILAIFVLSIIKSIVSVVKDRMRPRYRFFRRLEGGEEEETAERLSLSTVGKGIRKFRFFRKL